MSNPKGPRLDVPPFDAIVDLVGNPYDADLVLFVNGNQFMVMPELIERFQARYPEVGTIFYETLPPGLLKQQIEHNGHLSVGSLNFSVQADVYTAGRQEMTDLAGYVDKVWPYAQNHLALAVPKGNPEHITQLTDLGRTDITIAMPNLKTEGIARLARQAALMAGGESLVERIFAEKVQQGTTHFTAIHHRQTVPWLIDGRVDVGVLWASEAQWAIRQGYSIELVSLPAAANPIGRYLAAGLKHALHPTARDLFLAFLTSVEASAIYQSYGFEAINDGSQAFGGF